MNSDGRGSAPGQKEETSATRAADDPVAKARHDLRNPLAHILGFSEMAMEKAQELGFNYIKARLNAIHRTANQMLEQINEALDASKIEAGVTSLPALQQQLRKLANKVIAISETLVRRSRRLADDLFGSDLERIISSARHLLDVVETLLALLPIRTVGESAPLEATHSTLERPTTKPSPVQPAADPPRSEDAVPKEAPAKQSTEPGRPLAPPT